MRIKFCGITNFEDAKNAIEVDVDYLGFIIDFPHSPRSIAFEKFQELVDQVLKIKVAHKKFPQLVAVVIDLDEEKLNWLVNSKLIQVLQFHGHELPEFCALFKEKIEVWRTFKIQADDDLANTLAELEKYQGKVNRFLIDASSAEDKAQGKNNRFDNFEIFKALRDHGYPLILAGGITPDNIETYVKELRPEIIDIASGIETSPGKKSLKKMIAIFRILKNLKNSL